MTAEEKLTAAIKAHPEYLDGCNEADVIACGGEMIAALRTWNPRIVVASLTCDPDLCCRAELEDGSTLFFDRILGPDADPTEDCIVAIYKQSEQLWSTSGPYAAIIELLG